MSSFWLFSRETTGQPQQSTGQRKKLQKLGEALRETGEIGDTWETWDQSFLFYREEAFARGVELYEDFGTKLTVSAKKIHLKKHYVKA